MWVFTEWATAFDKVKADNAKALDSWLQDWVATTLDDNSPWYRNAFVYTVSGLAYGINTLSTEVLGSFVDVLRLGDGVREGGWGYGRDVLRLLVIAGPTLRVARYGITLVAAVDEAPQIGNCTWVAATRALRMTGVKHYARVGDLAQAAGVSGVGDTGGAFVNDLLPPLKAVGAEAKPLGNFSSMSQVIEAAAKNPNGVVMFSVEWEQGAAKVGHSLLAVRGPGGVIRIIDRGGKVVSLVNGYSLAELEPLYQGISNATVYGDAAVVQNARIVNLLNTAPSLLNVLAVELRSAPVPPPLLNPSVVDVRTRSIIGTWTFEIPSWKATSEGQRYAEGWKGIVQFEGTEKDSRGKCFWSPRAGGQRHYGWWSVTPSTDTDPPGVFSILTFQFDDDNPKRTFSARVGNFMCQGQYKNPGWPDGGFRISR